MGANRNEKSLTRKKSGYAGQDHSCKFCNVVTGSFPSCIVFGKKPPEKLAQQLLIQTSTGRLPGRLEMEVWVQK